MRAHGTRARYVFGPEGDDWRNGCRCFECSQAAVLYEKRRIAARARGEQAYVDATEAREHLQFLRSRGIGRRTVAARTGLSQSQIRKVATGQSRRIRPATADKILGVHAGHARPRAYVDGTRTLELINELVAHGHTKVSIARALGQRGNGLQLGKNGRVTQANADRVEALHAEWMRPVLVRREHDREKQRRYRQAKNDGEAA